jgi:multidrug efflux pump subunit AcrA (membrane-fusion protein)
MAFGLDALKPLLQRRRRVAVGVAVLLVLAAAAMIAHRRGDATPPGGGAAEQSAVIQARPFASTIGVAGTIAAGPGGEVTAPFDGVVRTMGFLYGEPVQRGQVLAVFDASGIATQRNEAEATALKADQTAADLASWSSGPEVSRARRAVAAANSDLQDIRRKIDETKALLDRGLVPRGEYDDLLRRREAGEASVAAAEQDLTVAMRRGEGSNRRVAALQLQNARTQLATLNGQVTGAVVRAPASGVMVRPPADKVDTVTAIHPGLQMTKGQLIGAIAAADALVVTFKLSETDANRVRAGQGVTVTGPGFPGVTLNGRVTLVAGEATPASSGGSSSTVAAVARLEGLTPEQAAAVRIGMTANVVIDVYRNPSAVVAPPEAIQGAAASATVRVKDPKTGATSIRSVRLGVVAPDGVEVLSGLKSGEVVIWTPPPAAPTTAQ